MPKVKNLTGELSVSMVSRTTFARVFLSAWLSAVLQDSLYQTVAYPTLQQFLRGEILTIAPGLQSNEMVFYTAQL